MEKQKVFQIPQMNEQQWNDLQKNLKLIYDCSNNIEKLLLGEGSDRKNIDELSPDGKIILGYIEKIHIALGLIDHDLGRVYTVDEAFARLKQMAEEKIKNKPLDK